MFHLCFHSSNIVAHKWLLSGWVICGLHIIGSWHVHCFGRGVSGIVFPTQEFRLHSCMYRHWKVIIIVPRDKDGFFILHICLNFPYASFLVHLIIGLDTGFDVSSIGACRPMIFFINWFLGFLEDEWQRNGERKREEMPLQGENESRRSSPP